nr:MAG TPA: hypothetical protein [Caudoviricetes sp.]
MYNSPMGIVGKLQHKKNTQSSRCSKKMWGIL